MRDKQSVAELPWQDALERVNGAEQHVKDAQAHLDATLAAKESVEVQLQVAQAAADPQATADARTALAEASEKVCYYLPL